MTIKVGRSLFKLRPLNKWDRIFVLLAGAIGGAVAVATMVLPFEPSLVIIEAIIGQLYPATLLARLVTLELEHRRAS